MKQSMPESLVIVLNFPQAVRYWRNWAIDEQSIDFRKDRAAADRCTTCYAALELSHFLTKAMPELQVTISEKKPADLPYVELTIEGTDTIGSFELKPVKKGLRVIGFGRNGLLNGIYELLRIQGWRWLEPGIFGESLPPSPSLDFLKAKGKYIPSFKHRMIDQYRDSDASVELLKWFSRNRINVVFWKPATAKFADKLGMLSRTGGHLLDKIMDVDALLEDGRTVWEAHPEWYGAPHTALPLQPRDGQLAQRTHLQDSANDHEGYRHPRPLGTGRRRQDLQLPEMQKTRKWFGPESEASRRCPGVPAQTSGTTRDPQYRLL